MDETKEGIIETIEEKIEDLITEAYKNEDGLFSFSEFRNAILAPTLNKNQALETAKPPDGGWGWVVVFSAFMCNFIIGMEARNTKYKSLFQPSCFSTYCSQFCVALL